VATCEICGTDFDDRGVQIVLPGLAKAFDRVDCAVRAHKLAGTAAAGLPLRGTLVDLGRGDARFFAFGGLSTGLAAALAGSRARLAFGSATVGVALLIATTAHLATRGGGEAEATSGPETLAPPARYAGDSADRLRAVDVARPAVERRPQREVTFALASATSSADAPRAARSIRTLRTVTRTRTQRPKATRQARQASRGGGKTTATSRSSASTQPGWGHGDKNHGHSGPSKQHKAAKQGKAHKHK
jgi:hypothetical protein